MSDSVSEELGQAGRRAVVLGGLAVAGSMLALALWVSLAPLHGAVVTAGLVKVAGNRKLVQHAEGGIVQRVLVRNGDAVVAGQPLAELKDVRVDANVDLLAALAVQEAVKRARLDAEQRLDLRFNTPRAAELGLPSAPGEAVEAAFQRELKIFRARRDLLDQQLEAYSRQLQALQSEEEALRRQLSAGEAVVRLAREELQANAALLRDQFVARARVIALERTVAEGEARQAEQEAALTQLAHRRQETALRVASARGDYQRVAAEEFKESDGRLLQLRQQLRPAQDAETRQVVVAPTAGKVVGLRINAAGEVLGPRDPLMEIVPLAEDLVVEARVHVDAIRHLSIGQTAELRFTTFNARATPMVLARLSYLSDDALVERDGLPHYIVQLRPDAIALRSAGIDALRPGMAAEVYIQTQARTVLDYLLAPILDTLRPALREP